MIKSHRIITAALVPTLALGMVGLGTTAATVLATAPAAVAAQSGPWSEPVAFTITDEVVEAVDVQTTSDGSVVALWYRTVDETQQLELSVAVRPAASAEWGSTTVLDVLPAGRESVSLVTAPDGSATVTWVNDLGSSSVLRTATLGKGATSWPAATDIATDAVIGEVAFAGSPSGESVAVWRKSEGRNSLLYVSERSGPDGAWSAPAVLVAADAYWPQAVVSADGAVTVAWMHNVETGSTVKTVGKAAGATGWSAPAELSAPGEGGAPRLSRGADGTTAVAWVRNEEGAEGTDIVSAVRPADSSEWGALHTSAAGDSAQLTDPLVGPDGDVTLVWIDYDEAFGLRTSTRSAATGDWSGIRTLSSAYVPEQFDASIGADGTVQVGWVQDDENGRSFYTAARTDGVWASATKLSKAPSDYAEGRVAVGPDGNATALWAQGYQLWTAGTGLNPATPPATRRDYAGADGFPDLYARTAAGGLLVYKGNASHIVSARADGGTWPTTSTLIPFGDLDGDGCNDTLVRDSTGALSRYTPDCGDVVTPTTPSAPVGTGWNGFDGFSYSGDLDGDGRPDLIARQISTGDLYMYAGTEAGKLTRVGRIGTGWKSLTIVGAGDLNKDGVGDLLARTTAGDLYRYDGNGTGGVRAGVKIGSGWNSMADIVGIGDLTADGTDDIVARTTAGDLYRYDGNGTGGVRAGVKIGSGWKPFTQVS
ncbi:FG-GAP repeat domain-containing protein [Streptomyces sp. NPDC102473]|uniref:FG-GAP repeat domain-containing protein n=1 Tax=Streptomyces sp. NPDC102473 TaxID=3366180 RepID=UPI003826C22A